MSFAYKGKQYLYNNLSLKLSEGNIIGLFGRNGEGKSTLMKLITGQLVAQRGDILTLGIEAGKRKVELLQQVYMLPEDMSVPHMTIREYFEVIAPFYPNYDETLASEVLTAFEVDWSWNMAKISLGQRKKAMIALALSLRTPILLLDEPTNGLDIPSKSVFRRLLAKYSGEKQLVIISTHQVRDLEQLIDHLLIIKDNKVVCNESLEQLSHCFSFGQTSSENRTLAIYTEPSLGGEYGIWERASNIDEEGDFSIELFFNAIITSSERIQKCLEWYKLQKERRGIETNAQ